MQYLNMRYYEPDMMRFSQKDMIQSNRDGNLALNRYSYVQNDPVNYEDPSDLRTLKVSNAWKRFVAQTNAKIVAKMKATAAKTVNIKTVIASSAGSIFGNWVTNTGNTISNSVKAKSAYTAPAKPACALLNAVKINKINTAIKKTFGENSVTTRNGQVGVVCNGRFYSISSPSQVLNLKACMDAVGRKNQKLLMNKKSLQISRNKDKLSETSDKNSIFGTTDTLGIASSAEIMKLEELGYLYYKHTYQTGTQMTLRSNDNALITGNTALQTQRGIVWNGETGEQKNWNSSISLWDFNIGASASDSGEVGVLFGITGEDNVSNTIGVVMGLNGIYFFRTEKCTNYINNSKEIQSFVANTYSVGVTMDGVIAAIATMGGKSFKEIAPNQGYSTTGNMVIA